MITHNEPARGRRNSRRAWRATPIAVAVLLAGAMAPTFAAHAQRSALARSPMLASLNLFYQDQPGSQSAPVPPLTPVQLAEYRKCAQAKYPFTEPVSSFLAGYSDITKLSGAAQIGSRALVLIDSGPHEGLSTAVPAPIYHKDLLACNLVTVQLDYHGNRQLPPITTTLLGFRFAPVTATAILSQTAPLSTLIFQNQGSPAAPDNVNPYTAVSVVSLELRLADVQINGVPLNVGSSCRSNGILYTPNNPIAPGKLVLTGGTNLGDPVPNFGDAVAGGTVAGEADIPPFTGCITPSGENLDPLLTASVSGPGNFMRMTAGMFCPFATDCKPDGLPTPQDAPLWTVTHGGQYSASGPLTLTGESSSSVVNQITITCSQSQISGVFPDETGPLRGGLATVQLSQIGGTTGCSGSDGSTWTVTQDGTAYFGPRYFEQEGLPLGDTAANIDQLALTLTGRNVPTLPRGSSCQVFMAGYQASTYSNTGSVLIYNTSVEDIHIFSSNCPDAPADSDVNTGGDFGLTGTYTLRPIGITVTSP
jgi:hypothetical protein